MILRNARCNDEIHFVVHFRFPKHVMHFKINEPKFYSSTDVLEKSNVGE